MHGRGAKKEREHFVNKEKERERRKLAGEQKKTGKMAGRVSFKLWSEVSIARSFGAGLRLNFWPFYPKFYTNSMIFRYSTLK